MECRKPCSYRGSKVVPLKSSCTDCGQTSSNNAHCIYNSYLCKYNQGDAKRSASKTVGKKPFLSHSETDTQGERKTEKTKKKQSCWEWFKSLLGFGNAAAECTPEGKENTSTKTFKPAPVSSPAKAVPPASAPARVQDQGKGSPCGCEAEGHFDKFFSEQANTYNVSQEKTETGFKTDFLERETARVGKDGGTEEIPQLHGNRGPPQTSPKTKAKSAVKADKDNSPEQSGSAEKKVAGKSRSRPRSRSPCPRPFSRKPSYCCEPPLSPTRCSSLCSPPTRRRSISVSLSSKMPCSSCRPTPPCPPYRPRSLSFTCVSPQCSICTASCLPNCGCKICCTLRTNPCPRRRPAKNSVCCCSPVAKKRKPRSCPRPTLCVCCPSPCPPRKVCAPSACPRPPSVTFCSKPCIPSCTKPCCQTCVSVPGICGPKFCCPTPCCPKPSYCPISCSVCPKTCRPSCCKPLSYVCTPGCCSCPSSSCCLSSLGRHYTRSKRGDSLCKMLLSKYSYNKSSANDSRRISTAMPCGGCRSCVPAPDPTVTENETAQAVPGNNRTNSRRSCSSERRRPQTCCISYAPAPNNKEPYKEVDLSSAIYTPCVKQSRPWSPVEIFRAIKKAESPSPCRQMQSSQDTISEGKKAKGKGNKDKRKPATNLNNGAIQHENDCHDLGHLRTRMESHYVRRKCRADQARALQKYEHIFNFYHPDMTQSCNYLPGGCRYKVCTLPSFSNGGYCRNNNFGDENFRFFRKYLNITPVTASLPEQSSEVDPRPPKVLGDQSQNSEVTGAATTTATASTSFDKVEERISRLDKWILGKGAPGSPQVKITKNKVARKKSTQGVGFTGGFRKKPAPRTGHRKTVTTPVRNPIRSQLEIEAAKRLMVLKQPDLLKFKSPQKSSDPQLNQTELKKPTLLESQKTINSEETKIHQTESKLGSPRRSVIMTASSGEPKQYTPQFKQENIVKQISVKRASVDRIQMFDKRRNSSPSVKKKSPERQEINSNVIVDEDFLKADKGESVQESTMEKESPALSGPLSLSGSRRNSPRRREPSVNHALPIEKTEERSPSPPLAPGESCVDSGNYSCGKPTPAQRCPSPKKSFLMSTIASIWGSKSKQSVCLSESPRVAGGMSSEYILSGKESSVDLEYDAAKALVSLNGSSNKDCDYHNALNHVEEDEGEESGLEFELNTCSSRESLVEANRSRNRGGGSMESVHDVPSTASQVNADQMTSIVSTMTGTVTTCSSNTRSCCSCSGASSTTTLSPSSSGQWVGGEPVMGALSTKIASMNLHQLLLGSSMGWKKVGEDDVDVDSIRRAKEEFMRRRKKKKKAAGDTTDAVAVGSKDDVVSSASSNHSVVSQKPAVDMPSELLNVLPAIDDAACGDDFMSTGSAGALCKQE